jgi:hypothetical protein
MNEEHHAQIKNTYLYTCIYLTCILYCFNKLGLEVSSVFYFLKNGVHGYLVAEGIRENTGNKREI